MRTLTPATLRAWRTGKSWTIPYTAKYFGVGARTWSRWEAERIPFPKILTLAVALVEQNMIKISKKAL